MYLFALAISPPGDPSNSSISDQNDKTSFRAWEDESGFKKVSLSPVFKVLPGTMAHSVLKRLRPGIVNWKAAWVLQQEACFKKENLKKKEKERKDPPG